MAKARYSTWIRKQKMALFCGLALGLIILALVIPNLILKAILALAALPFSYISFILLYSYYQFSKFGGNYQARLHDLIVKNITVQNGRLLDIGTGSGALIIKAAKAAPGLTLTGLDYWGEEWEYSQKQCEANACLEGVADRITFIRGSASRLQFADETFDMVVSCLTFHEVKDAPNKLAVIKEAFRVLKKGGQFVFLDLFLDETKFGKYNDFVHFFKAMEVAEVEIEKLNEIIGLPGLLQNRKVLGLALVVKGIK
jgi:ubiquinone/menaquinone biosynthesis C-methylase UbiE